MSKIYNIKVETEVVCKLQSPQRIKKSIESFRVDSLSWRNKEDKRYPCLSCENCGRIRDPSYDPDPVEGHKMTPSIPCPYCNGTGFISRELFKDYFRRVLVDDELKYQDFLEYKEKLETVCSKLTLDEFYFMKNYFSAIYNRYRVYK